MASGGERREEEKKRRETGERDKCVLLTVFETSTKSFAV